MRIWLNGKPIECSHAELLDSVLARLHIDAMTTGIAVAINEEIVPRNLWMTLVLADGDHVEVVHAAQGG